MANKLKEHKSAASFSASRNTVVTIGTFDGVHLGHKAILKRLVETAQKEHLESVLLTFFPHPRMVLQKDSDLKLLNTLPEKKALLEELGVDHIVVQPFTREFSRLNAVEYVRDILVHQLKAKKIIIGYDHRFGRNRTANIDDLKEFGEVYDFVVEEISAKELDDVTISSTKIRNALSEGAIETANNYLGYSYQLHGTVVKGKSLGKTISYPTANLKVSVSYKLIPKNGVYLTKVYIANETHYGLTSIGTNPTVGGTSQTIETFILDFEKDLYGKELTIEFIHFIRDELVFENMEALKKAIHEDEKHARSYLAKQ